MKIFVTLYLFIQILPLSCQAVQVAFFVDHLNPSLSFDGEFSHVAVSYKGMWLHSHPSRLNGRLTDFPGVHISQNLSEIGLNFIVFENPHIEDPSDEFYNNFKNRKFNLLAKWNSTSETHCSILVGKHLKVPPSKMKFRSSLWRNLDVSTARGKLGLSPKEIFKHIQNDPLYSLYYQSPLSNFNMSLRKMKCSSFL